MLFSRDSFDRFGDDLSAHLMSYLSLGDCVRLECVNKQWQRVVFSRQNRLILDKTGGDQIAERLIRENNLCYLIDKPLLARLVRKCPLLSHVYIGSFVDVDDDIIRIICQNCESLTTVDIFGSVKYVTENCWQWFAEKCGKNLEKLAIDSLYKVKKSVVKTLLRSASKLTECQLIDLNDCIFTTPSQPILPRLNSICALIDGESKMESFGDLYARRVTKLELTSREIIPQHLIDTLFSQLTRFERLETLRIELFFSTTFNQSDLNRVLNLLAKYCRALRDLTINVNFDYGEIFHTIGHRFDSLRSLTLLNVANLSGDLVGLKCCPNLTNFHVVADGLSDHNFIAIGKYAPKLRHIKLYCVDGLTGETLQNLAALEMLISIEIDDSSMNIADESSISGEQFEKFIAICQNLKIMKFACRVTVTEVAIDMIAKLAERNPKARYLLSTYDSNFVSSLTKERLGVDQFNEMVSNQPKNFEISLYYYD